MTDNSVDGSERVTCPEYDCDIPFPRAEEVVAHLQWDHNRSKLEAERKVRHSLQPATDQEGSP